MTQYSTPAGVTFEEKCPYCGVHVEVRKFSNTPTITIQRHKTPRGHTCPASGLNVKEVS